MEALGHTRRAIAEDYIPPYGHGPEPRLPSHETACLLNGSNRDVHVQMTVFYSHREPVGRYCVTVPATRTQHIRCHDLTGLESGAHVRGALCACDRIGCADPHATYTVGLAPSRKCSPQYDRLCRLSTERLDHGQNSCRTSGRSAPRMGD